MRVLLQVYIESKAYWKDTGYRPDRTTYTVAAQMFGRLFVGHFQNIKRPQEERGRGPHQETIIIQSFVQEKKNKQQSKQLNK